MSYITSCFNTGYYQSVTGDLGSLFMTANFTIGLCALGAGIGIIQVHERRLARSIHRLEEALGAPTLPADDPVRPECQESLRIGQEALAKVQRAKLLMLGITLATSGAITSYYSGIGCPGFDYWSEVKNEVRRIWPSANRLPFMQPEL